MPRRVRRAVLCVALLGGGLFSVDCSSVRGAARNALFLDSSAGDPDLEGDTFVAGVHTEGRFDRSDADAPIFAWSGTRISARFTGTAAGVVLDDARGKNEFYVFVDGKLAPDKLVVETGRHSYLLGSALGPGLHEVAIHRLTEASLGETTFLGFRFGKGGKLVPGDAKPARRRMEVIGDSISAGYGNEGKDKSCPFSPQTENHYLTYGALAARALDAEVTTVAWSGKGVFSNRGDKVDTVPMPVLWRRTLPERDDSRWDYAQYQPDVVVINLGTNDFAPGNPDWSPFPAAYLQFVREVRSRYPKAAIFCALGPALSDAWPDGRRALTTARQGIQAAVDGLSARGDARVYFVEFPVQTGENGYGCDWHPNTRTHAMMAEDLERAIREKVGW
jgi:lysophospholipase L1-like esterase